jgi:hypothetical protein
MRRRIKCTLHRFMHKCWAWYVIGNSIQVNQMDTRRFPTSSKIAYWFRHLSFMLDMLLFTFSTLNFQTHISVTSHATASNTNKESPIRLKSKFVNHDLIECVILNMKLISSVHFPRFCITWSVDTVTLDISLKMNGIHIIMAFPWYPHSWQCWLCSCGRLNLSRLLHTVRRTSFGWERGS